MAHISTRLYRNCRKELCSGSRVSRNSSLPRLSRLFLGRFTSLSMDHSIFNPPPIHTQLIYWKPAEPPRMLIKIDSCVVLPLVKFDTKTILSHFSLGRSQSEPQKARWSVSGLGRAIPIGGIVWRRSFTRKTSRSIQLEKTVPPSKMQ
jgi:hypothetical protein